MFPEQERRSSAGDDRQKQRQRNGKRNDPHHDASKGRALFSSNFVVLLAFGLCWTISVEAPSPCWRKTSHYCKIKGCILSRLLPFFFCPFMLTVRLFVIGFLQRSLYLKFHSCAKGREFWQEAILIGHMSQLHGQKGPLGDIHQQLISFHSTAGHCKANGGPHLWGDKRHLKQTSTYRCCIHTYVKHSLLPVRWGK